MFIHFKKLKNLKLVYKLSLASLLIGLVSIFLVSYVSYQAFEEALLKRTFAQLSSINILKKRELENYFQSRSKNLVLLANDPVVRSVLEHPEAELSIEAVDYIEFFQKNFQYQGVAILDNEFTISIASGLFKQINLDSLIKSGTYLNNFLTEAKTRHMVADLTGKLGKGEKIFLFSAYPIVNKLNENTGIVLVAKNAENLTEILYERTGMGETGESYIVGDDFRMRSRSRFMPETPPQKIIVRTVASEKALNNEPGFGIVDDYRGIPVLSVYRKLDLPGMNWGILSEIDEEEAFAPIFQLKRVFILIAILVSTGFAFITVFLSKKLVAPIISLRDLLRKTAKGILPENTPKPENEDEIGEMIKATALMIDALKRTTEFAHEIGNGNFEKNYQPLSNDDNLGYSLLQMRDKLKVLTENELKLIRENSLKLLEGQEEERNRISRELHDGLGQILTAIRFKLGGIKNHETLKAELRQLIDETIAETRRISNNLMPSVLVDFGLEAGIRKICKQTEDASGIKISCIFEQDVEKPVPFEISTNVFRIIQEGLNNISRHSGATEAEVAVFLSADTITVEIADNGSGFGENKSVEGKGLKNIQDRVKMLKGKIKIHSAATKGTVVLAEIPFI